MATPNTPATIDVRFRRYYRNLEPIFKKPKARTSVAAVFSFLAVSLFLWYAVRPTAETIFYLQREIADKTATSQQMEQKISSLIQAQSAYENVKDRLPLLDQALPHQPDAVILARELRNIADASGASVSAIQIPQVPIITNESTPGANLAAAKPLETFPVTVVITGQYQQLKSFLTNVLSLRRITTIDQIAFKQGGGDANAPANTLQLFIRLKTYYSLQ